MKKNLFFGLFATMMLLLTTACQKENDLLGNGEATISFEISTPQMATRAFSDGTTATQLQYAVYDANNERITRIAPATTTINGSTQVNIQLAAGKTYKVLFWAANEDAPYTIDFENLKMNVNYTGAVSNDERRDAFYCYYEVTADRTKTENVTLTRPFAQLNIGTNDFDKLDGVSAEKTSVKVDVFSTLNFVDGSVEGQKDDQLFALNAIPSANEKFPVDGYDYLAMNYLLVGMNKKVVDVEFSYGNESKTETRTFTGIPVMANYRTNIYGALLTNNIGFDVEIEEGFDGDANTIEDDLNVAAQLGGTYTLTGDVELTSTLNVTTEFTLDLNGKTISGAFVKGADNALINIDNGAKLTIVGGVVENTEVNGAATIRNAGNLVLNGVEIKGAPIADGSYPDYAVYTSGSLVVEEGTKISSDRGAINMQDGANVIINGGNIEVTDALGTRSLTAHVIYAYGSASKLTINDGNFSMKYAATGNLGASVICPAGATIKVYGGNFYYAGTQGNQSGIFQNYMGYGAPVDVYGGIYNDNTVTKSGNLAEGYKAVESNGKWVVVAEDVDAVVSTQEALNNATFADDATIVLTAGEYVLPDNAQGKTFTIQGTNNPADVKLTAENDGASEGNCDYSLRGSKVTFNNITVTTTGTYFPGYAYMEGTFNNCIINGVYAVYRSSSFNDCTFNVSGNWYNLWTWGGEEVNLNNCTFNCDGKAVLLYGTANTKLTANNCTFNDNGDDTVTGKAAIEIGNDYNKSYELVVNNATVNGFAINPEGYNTGSTLWANKNSMGPDKLKVTIDGENGYKVIATERIENMAGTTYSGDFFENTINDALYFNNWVLNENATIKVNRTYGAIILENVSGALNGNVIEIDNQNNSVMVLQDCNFTLKKDQKLIKSVNTIYQVFMSNITINGEKLTQATAAQYLENVGWYQVVEEI